MPTADFRDVTAETPDVVHFPDVVRDFQDLGFVPLGRMRRVINPGGTKRPPAPTRSGIGRPSCR